MEKIYVADVPQSATIRDWLGSQTNWFELYSIVKPRNPLPDFMAFTIDNFDVSQLHQDINEALEIYGNHGWKSKEGESKRYTGFSLVYNPDQIDNLDPHSSTLGTPRNAIDEFYYNRTENHRVLKNSYFDSFGFIKATPASEYKSIGTLMQRCKRTRIRSRLSIINGMYMFDPSDKRRGWHKDEPIFENVRINIPITTTNNYLFDLEGYKSINLPVGRAYCWDTYKSHRVYNQQQEDSHRIHMVLGFSPWWDYLPDEKAWVQNEFYGVKHPFDMMIDGDIFDGIHLDEQFGSQLLQKAG